METALNIASYFSNMYWKRYHEYIDEMKMHKLLYLAQRESLARTDMPLFAESFCAWQYGPVVSEIRKAFRNGVFQGGGRFVTVLSEHVRSVLDYVFSKYSGKDSWSLSRLTHAEYSWQTARARRNCGGAFRLMSLDDIRVDAQRIAKRRKMLHNLGLGAI